MTAPEVHEIAEILPHPEDDVLDALTADIKANGLIRDIIRFENKILDGRHRLIACLRAGISPRYADFDGTWNEAVQFVLAANLARRNLNPNQKALAAVRLTELRRSAGKDELANLTPARTKKTDADATLEQLARAVDKVLALTGRLSTQDRPEDPAAYGYQAALLLKGYNEIQRWAR